MGDDARFDAADIDYITMPQASRVDMLAAIQRQRALLDWHEQLVLHAMNQDPLPNIDAVSGLDKHWVREDVACVLRISHTNAEFRLHVAEELASLGCPQR